MNVVNIHPVGPADAARRMRISIKALRHYEKRGLLKPRRARNGWRVYDRNDLARLEQILAFKAMGFGLAQIASLLDATPDVLAAAFAAQELNLKGQVRRLNDALDAVRVAKAKQKPSRVPTAVAA